jgi:hypothetical protein
MLLIEFNENLSYGLNIIKYRNAKDNIWNYLHIDIETLHLLLLNFGIFSTKIIPNKKINIDNLTTSKNIIMKYCGAPIQLYCGCNDNFNLAILEQNY